MNFNPPYKVRAAIYLTNVFGSPVIGFLLAKNIIDAQVVALWTAEVAAAFLLAGLNVTSK